MSEIISVIIPVYNVYPYLREALDSVINQTYKSLEIIIVDDGSTDGSDKVCDEYAQNDNRIIVIHQENRGLSNARNVGLNLMKGEAVAFFDSDDVLLPDFVQEMYSAMIQSQADLVVCRYIYHKTEVNLDKSQGRVLPLFHFGLHNRITALRALATNKLNPHVWNKLYKRKLWRDIRFPEGRLYEDIATTFRILDLVQTICVVKEPLYLHRNRKGSINNSYSLKKKDDWLWAYSQFETFVEKNTPDIFTFDQLKRVRLSKANNIMNKGVIKNGTSCQYYYSGIQGASLSE